MYKVMLVDDEYMILEGLKFILPWETLGFEIVKTARNAAEALGFLKEQRIDLLITDITMPEMSGIELVEKAQANGDTFFTIILSGYQEFAYVKRGIELGVKNYLVKPVDKEELRSSLIQIREELDTQQELVKQQEIYKETNLVRWLNDELNEAEFQQLKKQVSQAMEGPFTPLLVQGSLEILTAIQLFFQEHGQYLAFTSHFYGNSYLLIYEGSHHELLADVHQVENDLQDQDWQMVIGETIFEWENLYSSFEKIKQVQSLQEFYPDLLPPKRILRVDVASKEEELPFLSFNKALMIGDTKTIRQELDNIFDQLLKIQANPEHVKTVSFLLFIDLYRLAPVLTPNDYEQTVSRIRNSQTIIELRRLFDSVLEMIKEQPDDKRYSETVQRVLQIINEEYIKDISLKTVSETLHLSVVYLGQLFKKETDLSFNQCLNQVRIKKAQELLLQTQQTINEISEAVGYNNTNYFSKMFKKLNGLTPKEFREIYEKGYEAI
ncbi:response regulator transcription factor [Enterococcus sp. JM9B]|uniref:response regulator transcription factor n=1 Tax=Enterococcus sp. JM9B TaxID=1857216 RepID=UPI0013753065|nr:response regulator transcription factor [Enterococcus sp. JM9B]KAF1303184.1 DNA-binding response regulator [Enterococcus sp. JM9B]